MKKNWRSVASTVVAVAMLTASFAGCSKDTKSTDAPEETTEATVSEETEATTTEEEWSLPPPPVEVISDEFNVIENPNFEEDDVSMWSGDVGSSKIVIGNDANEALTNYTNYALVDRDPATASPYDCLAQDVTDDLINGITYTYDFWVKLSSDYEGAPADQRTVNFAPYMTVNGETTYLGSYSAEIDGLCDQVLEPGVWTRFCGTFTPKWSGSLDKAVVRVIEQGTDYGNGDCVKGKYYVAAFKLIPDADPETLAAANQPKEIQQDITALRDVVASADGLGEGAFIGTSVTGSEVADEVLFELVEKHFNAVTLGNELKPDCMFGYNNAAYAEGSLHEEELNGETITVPTLDHSRADKLLDKFLEWNEANPDKQIKVRGHVLVWHSQTPEWFFHEDYDASKDYVSKDEMNKRLEWYIKSMLEYYTGEDSKYKDLFYGWDVVNEAISDATNTYRTHEEAGSDQLTDSTHGSKSSWWKVYESNEFIINAFKFANKYAPASLELYYNDYNECNANKCKGICELIEAVKAAEGTRIDGFGMQGHYTVNAPSISQIEACAREYAKVVDKIMLTELDVKNSALYDGSDEALADEYNRQAVYYNQIYELMKTLNAEDGINVSGITVWGVIDTNSWLQTQSNVGGGANGAATQYPLLFDGNYQAKPSYWAFVDPSDLDFDTKIERPEMEVKKGTVTVDGEVDDAWADAEDVKLDIKLGAECTSTAKILWDEDNLYVLFTVKDGVLNNDNENAWEQDSIEVFIDENCSKAGAYEPDDKQYRISYENFLSFNGEKCLEENMKSAAVKTDDGYIVEASFKWTDIKPAAGETSIGLELQVNDANADGARSGTISWADNTGSGYMNPEVFGTAKLVE